MTNNNLKIVLKVEICILFNKLQIYRNILFETLNKS